MRDTVVLVTGANGGLGVAVTRAILDGGASVVGVSLKIEQSAFPDKTFVALKAEIMNLQTALKVVDGVLSRFGKLDALVHLVGGFAGGKSVAETDDATFEQMLEINLNSVFHVVRAVLPVMRKNSHGRIVAIGSRAAVEPGSAVGAYSASKAAMVSLMRTIALENRDAGINTNVILPGTMDTPANRKAMPTADTSKWVRTESVASLVVWLLGRNGDDINGAVLPIYGRDA
jgi:NAD(P)-dependent dehydrogenase (short-subunit alcohol dehydrogenase family)